MSDTSEHQEQPAPESPLAHPAKFTSSDKRKNWLIAALAAACVGLAGLAGLFKYDSIQAEKIYAKNVETITRQRDESEASAQAADAEIQRRDVIAAKQIERLSISDGYPLRAERPIRPLDHNFLNDLAWLNSLPFGASKASVENAIPNLTCTGDGRGCSSGLGKNLNKQCLSGINRECETVVLFFSKEDALKTVLVSYKYVDFEGDHLIGFLRSMEDQMNAPSQTETFDGGMRTMHYSWKIGEHGIVLNAHSNREDGSRFYTLNITQAPVP